MVPGHAGVGRWAAPPAAPVHVNAAQGTVGCDYGKVVAAGAGVRSLLACHFAPMRADATLVAAPRQRNSEVEKADIKAGRVPRPGGTSPWNLRQKDRDARWTMKFSKAKPKPDGTRQVDIAIPAFGHKNHISVDRRHKIIRRQKVHGCGGRR